MKRSRPLSLFSSVLFLIFLFPVISLGASDNNLISPDITTWTDPSESDSDFTDMVLTSANNIYRVSIYSGVDTDNVILLGLVTDQTSLIAGHSYSLSFKMPSKEEVNNAFNKDYSDNVFQGHFEECNIMVGIGFMSPSGELSTPIETCLFDINSENYTNFFGKTLKASFIASSFSGSPFVYISLYSKNTENHSFYFSDFKLVDNDDNSAELTGIKGFLHSIRWDLVGGTCEEEDCPHSSGDNPHLSLSERMSSGFASMFQNIGDKFEEGSTLNTWFNNLSNNIGNLDGSLSNLGDRFQGFIDNLGDSFSIDIGDFKTSVSDWFDNLQKSWDDWIAGLKLKLDDVGASITAKAQEIGDKFTEFFDKFKPRVYLNLDWTTGYSINASGDLVQKPQYNHNTVVTDFFFVEDGAKYLVNYMASSFGGYYGYIYRYDQNGNYIDRVISQGIVDYELEAGYNYRFMFVKQDLDFTTLPDVSDYSNTHFKIHADEGWINAFLFNLKSFVSSFFRGFGNLILYFNWDGNYTNPFEREDSPIDKVSEFFDDLIEYVDSIGTSIENILDSITGGLHIFDEFTSRFPWLKGIAMFCLAIIVLSRFIGL